MQALKFLHLVTVMLGCFVIADEAIAEALWCSHRHNKRIANTARCGEEKRKIREAAYPLSYEDDKGDNRVQGTKSR